MHEPLRKLSQTTMPCKAVAVISAAVILGREACRNEMRHDFGIVTDRSGVSLV